VDNLDYIQLPGKVCSLPTLRRINVPYFRTQKPEQPGRDVTTSDAAVDGMPTPSSLNFYRAYLCLSDCYLVGGELRSCEAVVR
jgi:hypothetical protein